MGTHPAWKRTETAVARLLGGRRVPTSGRQRGDAPDVAHPAFSIEVKHRASLPAWLTDAAAQAKASARGDQIPLVVLHPKGGRHVDDLAVIHLGDLVALIERDGDA